MGPSPPKGHSPQFSADDYCGQMAGWIKYQDVTWYGGRPRPRPHSVRWEPSSSPKGTQEPSIFVAKRLDVSGYHYGQTAAWVKKMPLGPEVGLFPGDIVLDGTQLPLQKRHSCPHVFAHVYCGQTAGWTKMSLGTEVGLGPRDVVLGLHPTSPAERGTAAPSFRRMYIMVIQLLISATAELLLSSLLVSNSYIFVSIWQLLLR